MEPVYTLAEAKELHEINSRQYETIKDLKQQIATKNEVINKLNNKLAGTEKALAEVSKDLKQSCSLSETWERKHSEEIATLLARIEDIKGENTDAIAAKDFVINELTNTNKTLNNLIKEQEKQLDEMKEIKHRNERLTGEIQNAALTAEANNKVLLESFINLNSRVSGAMTRFAEELTKQSEEMPF